MPPSKSNTKIAESRLQPSTQAQLEKAQKVSQTKTIHRLIQALLRDQLLTLRANSSTTIDLPKQNAALLIDHITALGLGRYVIEGNVAYQNSQSPKILAEKMKHPALGNLEQKIQPSRRIETANDFLEIIAIELKKQTSANQ